LLSTLFVPKVEDKAISVASISEHKKDLLPTKFIDTLNDDEESLYFPHVDSCMVVAFVLENECIIGGHIGAGWPGEKELNYKGNAQKVIDRMLAKVAAEEKSEVIRTIAYVNTNNMGVWKEALDYLYVALKINPYEDVDKFQLVAQNCPKGAHITIDTRYVNVLNCGTNQVEERSEHSPIPLSPSSKRAEKHFDFSAMNRAVA
jgi:hypothetical protein